MAERPEKESPLKKSSLRSPGQSLAERTDQLVLDRVLLWGMVAAVFVVVSPAEWVRAVSGAPPQPWLYRGDGPPGTPGCCMDGLPWPAMKVNDRVGQLRNMHQAAEALMRNKGVDRYEPEARRIYGLLRETWERAVEEVLFNGVVIRFGCGVQTNRLAKVLDIDETDVQTIEEGMTKSSRFLEGHDEGAAVGDRVPGPDELKEDIDKLGNWAKAVRKRRK